MAGYTQHYGLHQWEPGDSFLRTDFNGDFEKIDAAVKGVETAAEAKKADKSALAALEARVDGKCGVVTGTYIGDGAPEREIALGFCPRMLLLRDGGSSDAVFLIEDCVNIKDRSTGRVMLALTDRGFQVKYSTFNNGSEIYLCTPYTNRAEIEYSYAAFR